MMPLSEQQVLALMGDDFSMEPVADLLIALGYPDAAKVVRERFDEIDGDEGDFF